MEDPENLGSGMAGAGDNLVKQYPPATHQFLEVPLSEICTREGTSIGEICSEVNRGRAAAGFTSALRVFILNYYRTARQDAAA